ncbi:oxaloacetate decarboxylase subunit alpha [Metallumcola ferriviriculae]|uniref:Oxaloacetate decarboxylase subunit alpha n=1 Tax=Metallumcola ferriviriculae TaxID=3039180 RepID=A0AAU0USC7_9FIRM|nr:oxaloacetate decarboxylase subunit alpha [Desulfitibacteraceae bacterium MK1]
MSGKPVGITDTTFRDAHQSLLATRMKIDHMLPIAEKMDKVGFYSMEVWGGATFDSCMRFLNEDPWERLRKLREVLKNTKLQMLLRGQNLVGYRHYADDVVEAFITKAKENGIDIFRIFDALNDVRNMAKAMEVAKSVGGHVQATISYTTSPVHNIDHYVEKSLELQKLGADSLCIKDMAGILTPIHGYDLVKRLKQELEIPIQLHCHYTSGMASMTYLKAIEAGVDVIDTAISSLSMGTSQPATEPMIATLQGTEWDTGLDLDLLSEIAEYFKGIRGEYKAFDLAGNTVDANVLLYQIPGGMLSNFYSQLSQQNSLDKLPDVLAEVPRVRKDFGYPPLVTPSSQIVGSQAVFNILAGERYKMVTNEVKNYMRGLYGRPPAEVDPEIRKKIIGDEQPIEGRPADLLEPQLPAAKKEIAQYMEKEEDIISYAIFPQVAERFLEERMSKKTKVDFRIAQEGPENGQSPYHPV